jgi:hypothetical protein
MLPNIVQLMGAFTKAALLIITSLKDYGEVPNMKKAMPVQQAIVQNFIRT